MISEAQRLKISVCRDWTGLLGRFSWLSDVEEEGD
jgi:hypothetical protein